MRSGRERRRRSTTRSRPASLAGWSRWTRRSPSSSGTATSLQTRRSSAPSTARTSGLSSRRGRARRRRVRRLRGLRKTQSEERSPVLPRSDLDGPAVQLRDPRDDRQAETGTAGLGGVEREKDLLAQRSFHALPAIAHRKQNLSVAARPVEPDRFRFAAALG